MTATPQSSDARAIALVVCSMASLQIGAAIATTAFAEAGPLGAVWVRSLVGGLLLAAFLRPRVRDYTREQFGAILPFAAALVVLNVFFFLALDRAPLGVVSAIEMLGPLTVAVLGRRGGRDLAWIGLAAGGVAILALARGVDGPVDSLGVLFSLIAAAAWGSYILLGKRVNDRVPGLNGLAAALVISAVVQTPLGLGFADDGLFTLSVLAVCALAGVLSTLIPFTFEMTALRTLSTGVFGLLMALEPAIAAVAGFAIRDQGLALLQICGIALIVAATAGIMGPARPRPPEAARPEVTPI